MFSDLVGSTALSARMDPEDLREVISAYQKCVAETVQRFGGFVAKYMGDGVLVYFGYPQAHEDDAERAVRAGLELVAAVSALKTHAPLQTRVGIATGSGGRWRSDRLGRFSGARHRRRDAEPCGAAARASRSRTRSLLQKARGSFVGNLFELEDLGGKGPQGYRRAGASLGCFATSFGGKPLRGSSRKRTDRTRRARRRTRTPAAALVEGQERRRSSCAALRRTRHRQVAA